MSKYGREKQSIPLMFGHRQVGSPSKYSIYGDTRTAGRDEHRSARLCDVHPARNGQEALDADQYLRIDTFLPVLRFLFI